VTIIAELIAAGSGLRPARTVLEAIERGEAGPFLHLRKREKVWIARRSRASSERLGRLLGVPGRTIRHWRRHWYADRLARRDEEIWQLYRQDLSLAEIGRRVGLTRERIRQIVAERKAGRRRYRRLF